jgi:hypothetical protein
MHKGLPVKGYQEQTDQNVSMVNRNKEIEETILRVMDTMRMMPDIDQRWLAIGRTHIEQGFMAMNRAVFKPGRVVLQHDDLSNANRDEMAYDPRHPDEQRDRKLIDPDLTTDVHKGE